MKIVYDISDYKHEEDSVSVGLILANRQAKFYTTYYEVLRAVTPSIELYKAVEKNTDLDGLKRYFSYALKSNDEERMYEIFLFVSLAYFYPDMPIKPPIVWEKCISLAWKTLTNHLHLG